MTKADDLVIAPIEVGVFRPLLRPDAHRPVPRLIRKKHEAKLDGWIANAKASFVSSFATGVLKHIAAVRAAIAALVKRPGRSADYETQTR